MRHEKHMRDNTRFRNAHRDCTNWVFVEQRQLHSPPRPSVGRLLQLWRNPEEMTIKRERWFKVWVKLEPNWTNSQHQLKQEVPLEKGRSSWDTYFEDIHVLLQHCWVACRKTSGWSSIQKHTEQSILALPKTYLSNPSARTMHAVSGKTSDCRLRLLTTLLKIDKKSKQRF